MPRALSEIQEGNTMSLTHLIRLPDREEYKKAIEAFLGVREKRKALPDFRMLVTNEHLAALRQKGVKFDFLSQNTQDGKP
jgi:hypothetical protein